MHPPIRWFASLSLLLAQFGWAAASGCGDGPLNLGGNAENWLDGNAIDGGTTGAPITLYEGTRFPQNYAVDESSLYVVLVIEGVPRFTVWKACDLGACAATVRTLYRRERAESLAQRESQLAVGGAEIFFTASDSFDRPSLMGCPATGCGDAPRTLTSASGVRHLLATEEGVYWDDGMSLSKCSRDGCIAPISRPLDMVTHGPEGSMATLTSFVVAGDYVYVAGQFAVARLSRDLSDDPDWVYRSGLPIQGLAVSGDFVYFAISTLTGEVRRCPLTGCVSEPEVIASAQRWPSSLLADERALHWLNFPTNPGFSILGSLASVAVDGGSSPKTLVSDLKLLPDRPLLMNSHHLYWTEAEHVPNSRAWIRTLVK